MENTRIKAILEAATSLFLRQGYARTQISHIASAIGVSVGTIYLDFAGKQEILHFMLKCAIDPDFVEQTFPRPISDQLFAGLEEELITTFQAATAGFSSRLERDDPAYTFPEFISDAFDLLARYAVGCLYIEKNPKDCGQLIDYYREYRRNFFSVMTGYMTRFERRGAIRPLEHLELTTTLIIEILTWWAMDMRYISFEAQEVPLELAKKVCLDNIITAYAQEI